ncbi:Anti-sigma-K factor rskA [Microbacterium azadirachtae]|uniref:Regulator of SigK n=1 Tax=Microbacterium azadirachtae TaxID=582680 RepID=A0A0F0LR98_9MICO|nr:anti-sigma factor [Microbacterium azadirachtae]KJL35214.1 Anti-sigma-K factor rskA [Microbacterium azadirachtae]
MNEQEFAELAAGHSLGSLSVQDEQRYEAALAAHPEWAPIVADDADTAALLAEGVPAVAPPPSLRDALLARIAVTPQEPADTAPAAAPPAPADPPSALADGGDQEPAPQPSAAAPARRPRRLLFALAACLVLVVGLGAGAAVVIPQLLRPAAVVALDRIENAPDAAQKTVSLPSGGHATAHWSASIGTAVLVSDGLEPLDSARTYELWFVRGDTPVSAGVFAAEPGTTTAQLRGSMHAGDAIAVTIEPAGGSPTGTPTTQPIIVIPTS